MWTVPRMEHPHIVVIVAVTRRIRRPIVADHAAILNNASAIDLGRQKEVRIVSLQRRRRFAVLALRRLRLHIVVGAVATRRQLEDLYMDERMMIAGIQASMRSKMYGIRDYVFGSFLSVS